MESWMKTDVPRDFGLIFVEKEVKFYILSSLVSLVSWRQTIWGLCFAIVSSSEAYPWALLIPLTLFEIILMVDW